MIFLGKLEACSIYGKRKKIGRQRIKVINNNRNVDIYLKCKDCGRNTALKTFVKVNRPSARLGFLIVLTLAFCMLIMLTSVTESFSKKDGSIYISIINSSYIPLSKTDANQVKANIQYTLENEKMQNQLVSAVMEVYAPNGTLIRTTSIGSGFTLQSNGGEQVPKTTFHDKSLQSLSIKILFTDLSKEIPLSNTITDDLKLEETSGIAFVHDN